MVPAMRGIGYSQMIANASVISYYTCLIALALFYLVASFNATLPWMLCDDEVNVTGTVCVQSGEVKKCMYVKRKSYLVITTHAEFERALRSYGRQRRDSERRRGQLHQLGRTILCVSKSVF